MAERLDLDLLERECATAAHVCNRTTSVLELIAELRATRDDLLVMTYDRDHADALWEYAKVTTVQQRVRAERAEESLRLAHMTCDKLQAESLDRGARAERAEAAIARALAECDFSDTLHGDLRTCGIRAALRGES